MPVNYYTENVPKTVLANTQWGQNDNDGDGDMDIDDINTPLGMRMYPFQGYSISAANFTVRGQEPSYSTAVQTESGSTGVLRVWQAGYDNDNPSQTIINDHFQSIDVNTIRMTDTDTYVFPWPEALNPLALNNGTQTGISAQIMINTQPEQMLLGGSPIQTGDVIGVLVKIMECTIVMVLLSGIT